MSRRIIMDNSTQQYERDTDEPYCEECGEDITPAGLFIGRCTNCSQKISMTR